MLRLCLTNHFQGGRGRLTTLILIVILLVTTTGSAQQNSKLKPVASTMPSVPADFRSKNFLVHTDLPSEDAKELLNRMETMLGLISRYWGRPNRQVIECYVVKDLKNWPSGILHPRGLQSIREGAGITLSAKISQGNAFVAKATVYSVADRGTPQHEAVHAYCSQTFGRTGPVWYSEGMAEMGQYWRAGNSSVNCRQFVVDYLRNAKPKSLNEIVNSKEPTGDSWQNYAWRWALCHLLANNSNYAARFRPLGLQLLTNQEASFEKIYGLMAKEITFEYSFFLKHLARGYRVDLCSWDWKKKYRPARGKSVLTAKINARRGWQASRLLLKEGKEYEYTAAGQWKTSKDSEAVSADGDRNGRGKLVGLVFHDYQLSEPFELGTSGPFKAPSNGKLLLRCRDKWGEIADNQGRITVRFKAKRRRSTTPAKIRSSIKPTTNETRAAE